MQFFFLLKWSGHPVSFVCDTVWIVTSVRTEHKNTLGQTNRSMKTWNVSNRINLKLIKSEKVISFVPDLLNGSESKINSVSHQKVNYLSLFLKIQWIFLWILRYIFWLQVNDVISDVWYKTVNAFCYESGVKPSAGEIYFRSVLKIL